MNILYGIDKINKLLELTNEEKKMFLHNNEYIYHFTNKENAESIKNEGFNENTYYTNNAYLHETDINKYQVVVVINIKEMILNGLNLNNLNVYYDTEYGHSADYIYTDSNGNQHLNSDARTNYIKQQLNIDNDMLFYIIIENMLSEKYIEDIINLDDDEFSQRINKYE